MRVPYYYAAYRCAKCGRTGWAAAPFWSNEPNLPGHQQVVPEVAPQDMCLPTLCHRCECARPGREQWPPVAAS